MTGAASELMILWRDRNVHIIIVIIIIITYGHRLLSLTLSML